MEITPSEERDAQLYMKELEGLVNAMNYATHSIGELKKTSSTQETVRIGSTIDLHKKAVAKRKKRKNGGPK